MHGPSAAALGGVSAQVLPGWQLLWSTVHWAPAFAGLMCMSSSLDDQQYFVKHFNTEPYQKLKRWHQRHEKDQVCPPTPPARERVGAAEADRGHPSTDLRGHGW